MISKNFQKLFLEAKNVRKNAHVPYSHFKVGAAFLTENDSIISGCNVENAAYPQSQCAEASAIGNLISNGYTKMFIDFYSPNMLPSIRGSYLVLRIASKDPLPRDLLRNPYLESLLLNPLS